MMYNDISREDNQSPPGFFYYPKPDQQKGGAQMADSKDRAEDILAEVTISADDPDRSTDQRSNKAMSENGGKTDGKEIKPENNGYGNLIPSSMRTPEERRKIAVKAGKASGESRRKRRTAKEIARTILQTDLSAEQVEEVLDGARDLIGDDASAYAVMIAKMVQEGLRGNVQAFTAVRDTAGDKPTDKQEVTAAVTAGDVALLEKVGARLGIKKADELTE